MASSDSNINEEMMEKVYVSLGYNAHVGLSENNFFSFFFYSSGMKNKCIALQSDV